uniref:Uncharacterized protein n=1 Tax=Rhodosorus marinus TaxID=101924 RepID=A0A7S3A8X6_9RHOD
MPQSTSLRVDKLLITIIIIERLKVSVILKLHLHKPTLAVWFLVDKLGRIREGRVYLLNLSIHRANEIACSLDGLDNSHRIILREALANFWQTHIHDVTELLSRM